MDLETQITRIRENLYRTRAGQKRLGIFLSCFSFVVLLVAESAIPIGGPASIFAGLVGIGAGFYMLYRQQELPLPEALEIARLHQGFLSAPLLIRSLHVTPETAERMLAELSERGYTEVQEMALNGGEVSYRVRGLEAPSAPPALPPA